VTDAPDQDFDPADWTPPPFRIEVTVDAPRAAVWRALTDETELRRWFGWDYEGLDAELRVIFFDHAQRVGEDRIEMPPIQSIALEEDGPRTIVRIWSTSADDDTGWDDVYHEVVQGWRVFVQQLRFALERHPGEDRRTLHASGRVVPSAAWAALAAGTPGRTWDATRFQRSIAADDGTLVGLLTGTPIEGDEEAVGQLTVSVYGQDEDAFARLRADWVARWQGVAKDAEFTE
jgi:uncharacterized protein YndB with AHSA1/START domain